MITKQETFKRLLSGKFDKSKNLDGELRNMMVHFGWRRAGPLVAANELVKERPVILEGYFYEDSLEWHKDIKQAIKRLNNK